MPTITESKNVRYPEDALRDQSPALTYKWKGETQRDWMACTKLHSQAWCVVFVYLRVSLWDISEYPCFSLGSRIPRRCWMPLPGSLAKPESSRLLLIWGRILSFKSLQLYSFSDYKSRIYLLLKSQTFQNYVTECESSLWSHAPAADADNLMDTIGFSHANIYYYETESILCSYHSKVAI